MAGTYKNITSQVAEDIFYAPDDSFLTSTNVKDALDELAATTAAGVPDFLKVTDFASLPAAGSVPAGTMRYVTTETGSYLLFTKRKRGWYESDGATTWNYAGDNTRNAVDSFYDATTSGLVANNVQAALDEIEARVDLNDAKVSADGSIATHSDVDLTGLAVNNVLMYDGANFTPETAVFSIFGRTGDVIAVASDYDADQIDYDNTTSGLTATDAQAAIDEIEPKGDSIVVNVAGPTATVAVAYTPLTGVSTTPPAGTYLAQFTTTTSNSNNNRAIQFGIFVGGVVEPESVHAVNNASTNDTTTVNCTAVFTVTGVELVQVQWFTSANTATANNQTLILTRLK